MCLTCAIFNPFKTDGDWLHDTGGENALTISETSDAAGNSSTVYGMSSGDSFVGTLGFDNDWDWVEVNLTAGVTYTFTMTAGSMTDPYLYLYDGSSNPVRSNDDMGTGTLNSQIVYTAATSGTYYIAADSYYNSPSYSGSTVDTGTYTLTMSGGGTNPPPPSGDDLLDSITWGYTAPTSINVYFVPGGVSFDDPYDTPQTTSTWSTYEQQQAMLAFETFENVANVNFNVVTNPNQADFFMVESTDPDSSLGYWSVGGTSVTINGTSYNNLDGHGVFYNGGQGWTTLGQAQGGYGFITMIHEIGHGMGLAHPHDTGGTSSIMDGVTASFGSLGNFDLNQGIYTTMSYNDGWQTAPHGASPSDNYGWQGTPMAMDIAVLQSLYGANTTFNNGNDTYELFTVNQTAFSHAYYSTIWDTGGIDTIVNPGLLSSIIDLREAPLTYSANGGGYVSYVTGVHGGFTIAAGAVIENATGGRGNDTIIGNDVANVLDGNLGNDTLTGGAAVDTFIYSGGQDVITDFNGDIIRINLTSWFGDVSSLLASAVVQSGNLVLDFGGGYTLTLNGVTSTAGLAGRIRVGDSDPESDLTGDGTSDILWRNGTTGSVGMFDMAGGTPSWQGLGGASTAWQVAGLGDFDGDGTDDILWRNETTGGTGMFAMGSGSPVWNGLGTAGAEWQIMGVGDFNGDGTDDILWQNSSNGGVGMFAMSDGSSSWQGIGGSSAPWEIVATGDITGDGIDDIIWRNATTGQVGQFEMSSSGTPTWSAVANASTDWRLVGTGDFDGDGTDDLLWRHEASGAVGMYAMGSGSPVWQGLGQASFDWDIVGVGDYNGDGTDDILWRNVNTGSVGMYDMDGGTPSWQTIGQAALTWDVEGQFVDEFVF
ncbi:FG-GAP-like repeat-containing protein [Nioella sp.]|uniref:FG-GAP-like repeat-containing protein n=1 Tax=Nioella sp. TaxID=1912091 RepID=UPI003A8886E0